MPVFFCGAPTPPLSFFISFFHPLCPFPFFFAVCRCVLEWCYQTTNKQTGPLEIIGIMFAATGLVLQKGKSRRLQTIPPRLMVRKWLKILIDRSLVLGTVDRPQLHDIVLEYVEAQFTEQECRQAHREVIKKFREATPAGGWSRLGAGTDLTSYYVVHEIEHHISAAWGKDKTGDKVAVGWCSDLWQGKTDAITSAATLYLGYDKLQVFAEDAEAKNDHWRAVRQYTAVISAVCVEGGDVNIQQVLCKRMYSELKLCTQDTPEQKFEFETIEIDVVLRLIKCWNKDDLDVLIPRVPFLLETDAAKNDFQCEYCLKIMLEVIPDMMSGNSKKMFAAIREVTLSQMAKTKALTDPGHINRSKLLEIGYTAILFDGLVADPDFVDALYGERGCRIEERYAGYDRDTDHVDCNVLFSADPIIASIGDVKALMFFWGEIDRARAMARWHINECAACFATREVRAELPTIWMASTFMPEACILTGLQSEAHTFVCEANNNCSYDELEDSMYDLLAMFTACTSKKYPKEGTIMNLLPLAWHNKFLWLLSAPQAKLDKLKPEILFEGLPGAKALACSHFEGTVLEHPHGYTCELALLCWPALLFERLGLHERALEFAEQALETVAGEGGNVASWNHILAHGVKGRIFLKTDKTAEAVKQFELGIEIAAVRKYAFLEAITLRDLKSALPQATSKHSAAERRFGTIMKTLAHGSSESKKDIEALVSTIFLAWE